MLGNFLQQPVGHIRASHRSALYILLNENLGKPSRLLMLISPDQRRLIPKRSLFNVFRFATVATMLADT